MRKIIFLSCIIFLLVTLSSCGKIDEVSQIIANEIDSLGEIDIEDEETIIKIEQRYSTLTDKQKSQVNNYAEFLKAKDKLDFLLKELQTKELNKKDEIFARERMYYDDINDAIIELKRDVNNPASVQIKEILVDISPNSEDKDMSLIICIYYTAQNGFGNDIFGYYAYYPKTKRGMEYIEMLYTSTKEYATGKNERYKIKFTETHHSTSEEENSNEAFIVDLEDYEINK